MPSTTSSWEHWRGVGDRGDAVPGTCKRKRRPEQGGAEFAADILRSNHVRQTPTHTCGQIAVASNEYFDRPARKRHPSGEGSQVIETGRPPVSGSGATGQRRTRGADREQAMLGWKSSLPRRQKRRSSRGNPAGATGLEPATPGFGDRCATNCATPLGCGAECTPTVLVTLCHEPCSGTRSQPCSAQSRSRSPSSRSGRRSREGVHGSLRSPRRRSPSGWGTLPGESGQADRAIWPTRWDESAGRRRILLGW